MEFLCFARFAEGLYCSLCSYERHADRAKERQIFEDTLASIICELTMEYGNQAVISDDYKTASFVMSAVLGDICDGMITSFMAVQHYTMEVTLNLGEAMRPPKHEMIGQYIMVPITCTLQNSDGNHPEPFINMTYKANIPAFPQFREALDMIGKRYVVQELTDAMMQELLDARQREAQLGIAYAATGCEAYGMDTD